MVAPLVWLLGFDLLVVVVYWLLTSVLGMTIQSRMQNLMFGLVLLINAVVIVVWAVDFLGISTGWLTGPQRR